MARSVPLTLLRGRGGLNLRGERRLGFGEQSSIFCIEIVEAWHGLPEVFVSLLIITQEPCGLSCGILVAAFLSRLDA